MDLPDSMQPSSDARILAWVGTLAALTAGALWVNRRRR
jgi:LPXTG-motif cell wall-anchored protein